MLWVDGESCYLLKNHQKTVLSSFVELKSSFEQFCFFVKTAKAKLLKTAFLARKTAFLGLRAKLVIYIHTCMHIHIHINICIYTYIHTYIDKYIALLARDHCLYPVQ